MLVLLFKSSFPFRITLDLQISSRGNEQNTYIPLVQCPSSTSYCGAFVKTKKPTLITLLSTPDFICISPVGLLMLSLQYRNSMQDSMFIHYDSHDLDSLEEYWSGIL